MSYGVNLSPDEIMYIESCLGFSLDDIGISRALSLYYQGATLDEIVEAIQLL